MNFQQGKGRANHQNPEYWIGDTNLPFQWRTRDCYWIQSWHNRSSGDKRLHNHRNWCRRRHPEVHLYNLHFLNRTCFLVLQVAFWLNLHFYFAKNFLRLRWIWNYISVYLIGEKMYLRDSNVGDNVVEPMLCPIFNVTAYAWVPSGTFSPQDDMHLCNVYKTNIFVNWVLFWLSVSTLWAR